MRLTKKVDPGQMTPEEKELLRRLLETPRVEKEWDFFKGMSENTLPPEFFMRGRPEPRWRKLVLVIVGVCAIVGNVMLNWGQWLKLCLFFTSIIITIWLVVLFKEWKKN